MIRIRSDVVDMHRKHRKHDDRRCSKKDKRHRCCCPQCHPRHHDEEKECKRKFKCECRCPVGCDVNVVHIKQRDVPSKGLVIRKPGRYCFIEDISWTPAANGSEQEQVAVPGSSAITIASSDVVLDLNEYTLSTPIGDAHTNNAGVRVLPSLHDVTVQNGTIRDIGAAGVAVGNAESNISLLDLTVESCGGRGGIFVATGGISPTSLASGGIVVSGGLAPPAVGARDADVLVRGCRLLSNSSQTILPVGVGNQILGAGINAVFVDGMIIEDTVASGTRAPTSSARGIGLSGITQLRIEDCVTDDNVGSVASVGISIAPTVGGAIINCTASGNGQGPFPSNDATRIAAGIAASDSDDVVVRDCVSTNTFATVATPPNPATDAQAWGFSSQRSNNVVFERCQSLGTTGGTIAVGFKHLVRASDGATRGVRGVVYRDCAAVGTTNTGGRPAWGFQAIGAASGGVVTTPVRSAVFENCVAEANSNDASNNTSGGFHLRAADECTIVDSIAKRNGPIPPSLAPTGNGIVLNLCTNCSVDNNRAFDNNVGVLDDNFLAGNNLITRNLAFNNVTNFSPAAIPQLTGTTTSLPTSATFQPLINTSVS